MKVEEQTIKKMNHRTDTLRLGVIAGLTVLMFAMTGALAQAAAIEATEKPAVVIQHFHAALLTVMKQADRLGFQGRYAKLEPEIRHTYDLPLVARLSIGRGWRHLSAGQRQQFVDVFSRLVIATYANRFDGYSGESFKYTSEQPLSHHRIVIHTLLVRPDDDAVQLDYILRRSHRGWRVINVIADGVSDLALKRADYASVLKVQGFHALINKLKVKIAQYR